MLHTKFLFIWPSGFREDFLKSANQKQKLPMAARLVNESELNEQSLQRTFHRCFLPSFGSSGRVVSEEKIKKNRPIRNKNCLWRPCLSMDRDKISSLSREPPIDASYQRCFLPSFDPFGQINRQYSSYCFQLLNCRSRKK